MKWLVTWESEMDTNDADYVKDNGEYGIVDDESREDMLKLLNTIISCDVYTENFDDGCCQLDGEEQLEKVYERLKTFGVTEEELDKIAEDGYYCVDPSDYKPRDPNGWSNAHDLWISFSKVPADAPSPDDCTDSWFKKSLAKTLGPVNAG